MPDDNNKTETVPHDKNIHQQVSGKNVAQTKEKTMPLQGDANAKDDQQKGKMANGDLGAGLGRGPDES